MGAGRSVAQKVGLPILSIALGLFGNVATFAKAYASELTVTTVGESGAGSLRQAITDSTDGGSIVFDASLSGGTITLASGALSITKNLSISGLNLVRGLTISGNNASRIFEIASGQVVTVEGLTVINGRTAGAPAQGGGIYNAGTLTLRLMKVSDNQAIGTSGAAYGGGLYNAGTVTVDRCTFSGNIACGGVNGESGCEGCGGAIYDAVNRSLIAYGSTFSGNTAQGGVVADDMEGGSGFGGAVSDGNAMTDAGIKVLINCTISGNAALSRSTARGGGCLLTANTVYDHVTVVSNTSSMEGGGIYSANYSNSTIMNPILRHSIVANNDASYSVNVANNVQSDGYNLITQTNGWINSGTGTGNIYGRDPMLGALADNGGATLTHLPLSGSPVIDAITSDTVAVDQRGVVRPQGAAFDIGAVEAVIPGLSQNVGPYAGGNSVTITNIGAVTVTNVLVGGVTATITGQGSNWVTITIIPPPCVSARDLPLGTVVYDDSWSWLGKTLAWRVVHTNYAGAPESVTLSATNTLGRQALMAAGWNNRWQNATLRTYLNSNFYNAFSPVFTGIVVQTVVPWAIADPAGTPGSGTVTDRVFIASRTELGGTSLPGDGTVLDWFADSATAAARRGGVSLEGGGYWTRTGEHQFYGSAYYDLCAYYVTVPAGTIGVGNWTSDALDVIPVLNINNGAQFESCADGSYRLAQNAGTSRIKDIVIQTSDNGDITLAGAYTVNPAGVIATVSPQSGSWRGGFPVVIRGANLCDGVDVTNVTLCGVAVSNIVSRSPTQIVVTASAGTPGTGAVRVYSTSYGETVESNAFTYVVLTVDHFTWGLIPSPQTVNIPFAVTVTAQDAENNTVTGFVGRAQLAGRVAGGLDDFGGGAAVMIGPTNTGSFVGGVWTGGMTVLQQANYMWLFADDGSGHAGTSGVFTVQQAVPGIAVLGTNGAAVANGSVASLVAGTDFGHRLVGTSLVNTLVITNTGNATLTVYGWTTNGADEAAFMIAGLPATLSAGGGKNFTVSYAPTRVGNHQFVLLIINNATNYAVRVRGSAAALSSAVGPYTGGNTVTITNGDFGAVTNVLVGGVAATITGSGTSWVTILLPGTGSAGVKDIVIQTSDNGDIALAGAYTVNPAGVIATVSPQSGSWCGGFPVVIRGTNLCDGADVTNVTLCGVAVSNIVSRSPTQIVVTASAGTPGTGAVRVYSTSYGESVKAAAFAYLKTDQTVAFPAIAPQPVSGSVGLAATASSGLPVTFSVISITGNLTDGTNLFFNAAGTVVVVASQAGDVFWNPAVSVTNRVSVYQLTTASGPYTGGNTVTITNGNFGAITNVLVGGVAATITGSGTSWVTILLPDTGSAGVKDIVVQTSDNGDIALAGAYTFNPPGRIGWTVVFPSAWTNLDVGMNEQVDALALAPNGDVYAGGFFTTAGDAAANYVARWNGSRWMNLGVGVNDYVRALAVDTNGTVYAGGSFTAAGGVSANYVAQWNGSSWTNLGSGMNGLVQTLVVGTNGVLYAGGLFTTAGGVAANYVAQWNGSNWTNLGLGVDGPVSALAVTPNGGLCVGGGFTTAGGVAVKNIAQWNGSTWTNLGVGVNGQVSALAVGTNGSVYAGGYFATVGVVAAKNSAQWNGSSWTNLAAGIDSWVCALTLGLNGALYAEGGFSTAGGVTANGIAQWMGNSWTNLESGLDIDNSYYSALAVAPNGVLYAGSCFTTAGGVAANNIAQWGVAPVVHSGVSPTNGFWTGGYQVTLIGTNLCDGADVTNVTLCGVNVQSIVSQSPTQIVVTAGMALSAGPGDVCVFSTHYGETVAANAFTYTKTDQTLAFAAIAGQTVSNEVELAATASSGATVTFAVVPGLGMLDGTGTRLSFTAAGWVSVVAVQAGDARWNAAPSVTNTFRVVGLVTAVTPSQGIMVGGDAVRIDGQWIGNGSDIASVTLCGVEATIVSQTVHTVWVVTGGTNVTADLSGPAHVVSGYGDAALENAFAYRVLYPPTAFPATQISSNAFKVNWTTVTNADYYVLDVSTSSNFSDYVTGYTGQYMGNTDNAWVNGLTEGTWYWYRLRSCISNNVQSLNSNVVGVPTGDAVPWVTVSNMTGSASSGIQEFPLGLIFDGTGLTYSVTSDAPAVVSAQIDAGTGVLRLTYLAPGAAIITVTARHVATGYEVRYSFTVTVTGAPGYGVGTLTNSAMEVYQTVTVTNTSLRTASGVMVIVSGLDNTTYVKNRTSVNGEGDAVIEYPYTLLPDATVELKVVYDRAYGIQVTNGRPATVTAHLILEPLQEPPPADAIASSVAGMWTREDKSIVIAIRTVPGTQYMIQYRDCVTSAWNNAYPSFTATAKLTYWVDSGQPMTDPHPREVPSRFYQVLTFPNN